jgi:hypothetical protein
MEGLEEERPAEMEGVKGEKPAESQRVEEQEREEKERVKKEKRDKKKKEKKDKKKKRGQKKEGEKSRSGKSPLGEGTVKKGGPDVAMKMALEIPDPLIQAGVARTLNWGETDSKDSDSTSGDEKEGEGQERGRAKKERASEKEKCYGHILGGGARTRQTARITAGSARPNSPRLAHPHQNCQRSRRLRRRAWLKRFKKN